MTTVADVTVEALKEAGVEVVFGLPGGEIVEVLDALRRYDIDFVLVHHETSAVFMADAVARLTGKPGVCLTTLGPGASNAVAGVAHAYLDRSPVLIITAQKPDYLMPDYTHQVLDLHALYRPITKGSYQLKGPGAREIVVDALALAMQGRPGPVHLQLSNEDASESAQPGPSAVNLTANPVDRIRIDQDNINLNADLDRAKALLSQAKRPLILAGLGLEPEKPYHALKTLAETLHAPVIAAPKGKGCIPDDHPLAAGTVGLTQTDPVYEILDEADCLIAVGFDVVELVKAWEHPAPLIWIAPWANVDPTLPAAVEFSGPMAPILTKLGQVQAQPDPDWGARRLAAYRQTLAKTTLPASRPERLRPQTVLSVIRDHIPRDTLVAVDVGSHKILASLTWPTYTPNSFFLSNGLSCMGFCLPTVIAAGLVSPGRPIVGIIGDAGLAMCLGELALLARLDTPAIMVVLNDEALDLIRSHQVRRGKPVFGTEFGNPDFMKIAKAYDLNAYRVSQAEACGQTVQAAIMTGKPALIEVMIDPRSYPTTPAALI